MLFPFASIILAKEAEMEARNGKAPGTVPDLVSLLFDVRENEARELGLEGPWEDVEIPALKRKKIPLLVARRGNEKGDLAVVPLSVLLELLRRSFAFEAAKILSKDPRFMRLARKGRA